MAGNKVGGKKAYITNTTRYGINFYRGIGSMGGKTGNPDTKGFASHPERAKEAGRKGGLARWGKADAKVKPVSKARRQVALAAPRTTGGQFSPKIVEVPSLPILKSLNPPEPTKEPDPFMKGLLGLPCSIEDHMRIRDQEREIRWRYWLLWMMWTITGWAVMWQIIHLYRI